MKKNLLFSTLFISLISVNIGASQTNKTHKPEKINKVRFDEKAALQEAKAKGLKPSEIPGYIQYLRNDFASKKALGKQTHLHNPYGSGATGVHETVIYLDPNKPMSVGCPNMGFEQYDFSGWTGDIGTVSTGATLPNYSISSPGIVNSAGNNVSVMNTTNYHTILSIPPTNNVYPACSGYDSLACKAVGSQTISEIPFISPYSFDPVSVRMNSANSNYRACRLKYITTSSATNQRLSFSYAVVLQSPGHSANESPYFIVEVKNENTGTVLPGCTSYTFNPVSSTPSDSLQTSVIGSSFEPTLYRKWKYYSVDLSSLPLGTNVSINFEVGGCTLGGHWGYAYVDAECGGIGTSYGNMCSGSTYATLVAPTGFSTYQWIGPSGAIAGATNDTLIVNPAVAGTVYTVNLVSPGGCALSQTVAINLTTVNIINLNSTNSCPGGNSGTAFVQANGSNGVYNYTWTATSGPNAGQVVSNSQLATGLAPGTYSVLVASTNCGQASANLSVGVAPPFFIAQSKPFCGTSTFIPNTGGSAYTWYQGSALIPAPVGTNDTLYINNAVAGDEYTLVYTNGSGCRDSIKYTLTQIAGGSSYFSDISNVCPGSTNGSVVLNLNTPFSAPYTYIVTGPTPSAVVTNTSTSVSTLTLTSLAPGTYTAIINDGLCIYNNTVTIGTIQTNFTITPTNTVLCFPTQQAVLNLNFGASAPSSCGLDPMGCSTPGILPLFNAGPFTQNGTADYPTPYGNWYTKGTSQFLIRKAELNAAGITAGKISSLAFKVVNLNASDPVYPDFSIKIGCTSLSTLPYADFSSPQPFVAGLNQVYSNSAQNVSMGWNTYNFTQAYVWDGNSNIVVEVCFDFPGTYNYTENISVELKQMPYRAAMYHVDDNNSVCNSGTPANNNGTLMTNGENMLPNMRFGYCAYAAPASDYTVSISSNGTIVQNYGDSVVVAPTFTAPPASNAPVVYTLTAVNPVGNCTATQTVAILYPALTTSITAVATTPTTVCQGGNVSFAVNGAVNYNWYYQQGSTQVPIATSSTINVTPPAVGINTYVVVGSSNCPSTTPDTKTVTVNVIPTANLYITPLQDVVKCLNKPFVLNTGVASLTSVNSGTPYVYSWTTLPGNSPAPGVNTASTYTANGNTTNTFVVTVSGNCAYPTSDTVVVSNLPDNLSIAILDSSSTCANTPFVLTSGTTGGYPEYTYSWSIDNGTSVIGTSPNLSYTSPANQGNYVIALTVTDSCGYNDTDYQIINVLPPCSVIIPNVITPNGDGRNDVFKISNIEYHPNTSVTIFDRWGVKVFETTNYNNDWKADGLSDGTFFYVIDVPDDKKYNGFISVYHGK